MTESTDYRTTMSETKNDENELNELLDNALQDFNTSDDGSGDSRDDKTGKNPSGQETEGDDTDAFFMEQAKVLADRMNTLFSNTDSGVGDVPPLPQNPEVIMAGFQKMAEAAALTMQGENPANDEEVAKYSSSIAQALKGLQEGADNLAAPVSEVDVANMFGSLNIESTADSDGNMFLPFMEGMMQSLLSAEILLPSIKELLEKYPKYFEQNEGKIPPVDKARFEKQLELYKTIAEHLESENADDSASVKREKFKIVLEDMRKLQQYGQPPKEILEDAAGDLPMWDPNSMAGAGVNPQCPMM